MSSMIFKFTQPAFARWTYWDISCSYHNHHSTSRYPAPLLGTPVAVPGSFLVATMLQWKPRSADLCAFVSWVAELFGILHWVQPCLTVFCAFMTLRASRTRKGTFSQRIQGKLREPPPWWFIVRTLFPPWKITISANCWSNGRDFPVNSVNQWLPMPLRNVPKTLGPASACRHCAPVRQHQPSRIHGDPGTSTCRRALEPLMDMDHGTHGIPCVHSRAGINLDLHPVESRMVWGVISEWTGQLRVDDGDLDLCDHDPVALEVCSSKRTRIGDSRQPKGFVLFWVVKNQPKTTRPFTICGGQKDMAAYFFDLWTPLGWRSITTDHRDHGMYPTKWGTSRIDNMIY